VPKPDEEQRAEDGADHDSGDRAASQFSWAAIRVAWREMRASRSLACRRHESVFDRAKDL
jgi:hypothetical protein